MESCINYLRGTLGLVRELIDVAHYRADDHWSIPIYHEDKDYEISRRHIDPIAKLDLIFISQITNTTTTTNYLLN